MESQVSLINKSNTALLVIDLQNGFVHPDSHMGQSRWGTGSQLKIIDPTVKLMNFCRTKKIPIILSQQEHFPDDVTRSRKKFKTHAAKQGFLPCLRNTWETELFDTIKNNMVAEDHIVQKHRASVFYTTNLEVKLRMLGTQFLIIAGCNTEFCIESSVRDAYARDFECLIIKDCVAGINPAHHENSLKVMKDYFGEVLSLTEFISMSEV